MTPVEIWKVIIEISRTVISWPLSIVVIAVYFFWRFKEPISELIKSIEWTSPTGHKIKSQLPHSQDQNIPLNEPKSLEEKTIQFIKDNPLAVKKEFETFYNGFWCEKIFNIIFGTQIDLLFRLDKMAPNSELLLNLEPFYEEYVRRSEAANLNPNTKEMYFGFIKSNNLTISEGIDKEEKLSISQFGQVFLAYILREYRYFITSKSF